MFLSDSEQDFAGLKVRKPEVSRQGWHASSVLVQRVVTPRCTKTLARTADEVTFQLKDEVEVGAVALHCRLSLALVFAELDTFSVARTAW